jgi:hypothetical protein
VTKRSILKESFVIDAAKSIPFDSKNASLFGGAAL